MKGLELGDWPAWLALIIGSASLGWQVWKEVQQRKARQEGLIRAWTSTEPSLNAVEIYVAFAGAEPHTRYSVRPTVRRPRRLGIAQLQTAYDPGGSTVLSSVAPAPADGRFPMGQTYPAHKDGAIQADFLVTGVAHLPMTLKVRFAVFDEALARPIAVRTLHLRAG